MARYVYTLQAFPETNFDHCDNHINNLLEIRLMNHELLRNHHNIVRLLAITWQTSTSPGTGATVTTPLLLTELAATISNKPLTLQYYVVALEGSISMEIKLKLLMDMISGLRALHALQVVHGDMKPSNVLLFRDKDVYVAKISDFGFCLVGDDELKTIRGGTHYWNAPETISQAPADITIYKYEKTRDLYSFGLVLW